MPKKISESIKEDIKSVALKSLHSNEPTNISMRFIAQQVGIATGTIYNYYNSKEAIYLEIIKDIWYEKLGKGLPSDRNVSIETVLNRMISLINIFYQDVQTTFLNIQEEEKYYLHYIMSKKMNEVLVWDLQVEFQNMLQINNINIDRFTSRFIVDSLIKGSFYKGEQSKNLVAILQSIIEKKEDL